MTESTLGARTSKAEIRQKPLREELSELLDVVGPAQLVDLLLNGPPVARDRRAPPTRGSGFGVRIRVDGMLHDVLNALRAVPQMISRQTDRR
jgi:hypothetical protein